MNRQNLMLALAAGLLGGLISRVTLPSVHAQNPQLAPVPPPPAVTGEVRAQSFTLVDGADRTIGTFTVAPGDLWIGRDGRVNSQGRIVLRDPQGREIWSAGGSLIKPLSENTR